MTSKADRVPDYLGHIIQAIERITRYTAGLDENAFRAQELVQDAVLRNIEIVGEAANNVLRVAPDYAAAHAHVPWQVMYAMRNRLTHGYDKVDLGIVWALVQRDLPPLGAQVRALLAAYPD